MTQADRLIRIIGNQVLRITELETQLDEAIMARESLAAQLRAAQAAAAPPPTADTSLALAPSMEAHG